MFHRARHVNCIKCKVRPKASSQCWCLQCRAAWMRTHRLRHSEMSAAQRQRANCRAYANVYQRRGKLVPQPCEVCGAAKVEKHHDDYGKPLTVRWFCRRHHVELQHALQHERQLGAKRKRALHLADDADTVESV